MDKHKTNSSVVKTNNNTVNPLILDNNPLSSVGSDDSADVRIRNEVTDAIAREKIDEFRRIYFNIFFFTVSSIISWGQPNDNPNAPLNMVGHARMVINLGLGNDAARYAELVYQACNGLSAIFNAITKLTQRFNQEIIIGNLKKHLDNTLDPFNIARFSLGIAHFLSLVYKEQILRIDIRSTEYFAGYMAKQIVRYLSTDLGSYSENKAVSALQNLTNFSTIQITNFMKWMKGSFDNFDEPKTDLYLLCVLALYHYSYEARNDNERNIRLIHNDESVYPQTLLYHSPMKSIDIANCTTTVGILQPKRYFKYEKLSAEQPRSNLGTVFLPYAVASCMVENKILLEFKSKNEMLHHHELVRAENANRKSWWNSFILMFRRGNNSKTTNSNAAVSNSSTTVVDKSLTTIPTNP